MKLRTGVQINAMFPIVLAVLVSVGLMVRSAALNGARMGAVIADELSERVADLTLLVGRSMARGEAADLKYSMNACDELLAFLRSEAMTTSDGMEVADRIAVRVETLKLSIEKLQASSTGTVMEMEGIRLRQNAQDNLRNLAVVGSRVARSADSEAAGLEDLVDRMFMGFVGAVALIMAVITLVASRSVIRRLQGLKQVCESVSDTNLSQQLIVHPGEEMEAAYRAFNAMMGRLQRSFVVLREERNIFKAEVEKSKSAAEAGRQANIHLADALARLKRAQDEIVMQERVRALEQIVVGVSRDFDTMLVPIITTSDFLLSYPDHLADKGEVLANLKDINRVAREANKRVRLLSEIFRSPTRPESRPVDLVKAINMGLQMAEAGLKEIAEERQVEYSVDVDVEDLDPVEGDEVEMVESLHALVVNAAEAMLRGGTVRIRGKADGPRIILEVADAGEGMGTEVKQRCLEPFFSTRGDRHRGMGLPTVVAGVGRFGGTVDIESSPGAGTIIRLTLKRYENKPAPAAPVKAGPLAHLKVLVVDDEDWARRLMSRILMSEKHSVETVGAGAEALRKVQERTFDLVILDRAMPNMSGDEVAVRIRDLHPTLPIILVSGLGDMMLKTGEQPAGIDVILSKPFSVEELRDAMGQAMQTRGKRRVISGSRKSKPR